MSDTPSPAPEPLKPRLSLAPKAPAPAEAAPAAEPAPAPAVPSHSAPLPGHAAPPGVIQSGSGGTPPALVSSGNKPSFKLSGPVHAANPDKFEAPKFTSPMPTTDNDAPSGAIVALSAIAAAAAITFAVLLFLKNQS